MTTQNKIELYVSAGTWMAAHFGPMAAQVVDLFGTNVLPTPYTAKADGEYVRGQIAGRNPEVTVTVLDQPWLARA